MKFLVGTSGYSYAPWKGKFYPPKLPQQQMLGYYAQHFPTVEINNTFYKLPDASVVKSWVKQVPASFCFALKAWQTITHRKRLKNVENETAQLLRLAAALDRKCGPLLVQLPPNFKKDLPRLESFLKLLPGKSRTAFEFRHESWFDDEVYACLRAHACALCVADTDELPIKEVVSTTNWGYVRLRRERYSAQQLAKWVEMLRAQKWKDAYVLFKHEETGTGPRFATKFLELIEK